jgi:hypothetical protein
MTAADAFLIALLSGHILPPPVVHYDQPAYQQEKKVTAQTENKTNSENSPCARQKQN